MKKIGSIVAVLTLTLGLFSCEAESNVQETQDLIESLEIEAVDGESSDPPVRE